MSFLDIALFLSVYTVFKVNPKIIIILFERELYPHNILFYPFWFATGIVNTLFIPIQCYISMIIGPVGTATAVAAAIIAAVAHPYYQQSIKPLQAWILLWILFSIFTIFDPIFQFAITMVILINMYRYTIDFSSEIMVPTLYIVYHICKDFAIYAGENTEMVLMDAFATAMCAIVIHTFSRRFTPWVTYDNSRMLEFTLISAQMLKILIFLCHSYPLLIISASFTVNIANIEWKQPSTRSEFAVRMGKLYAIILAVWVIVLKFPLLLVFFPIIAQYEQHPLRREHRSTMSTIQTNYQYYMDKPEPSQDVEDRVIVPVAQSKMWNEVAAEYYRNVLNNEYFMNIEKKISHADSTLEASYLD